MLTRHMLPSSMSRGSRGSGRGGSNSWMSSTRHASWTSASTTALCWALLPGLPDGAIAVWWALAAFSLTRQRPRSHAAADLQVPQFLLEDMVERGEGALANLVCTQPRRIAAISVADRCAHHARRIT